MLTNNSRTDMIEEDVDQYIWFESLDFDVDNCRAFFT